MSGPGLRPGEHREWMASGMRTGGGRGVNGLGVRGCTAAGVRVTQWPGSGRESEGREVRGWMASGVRTGVAGE